MTDLLLSGTGYLTATNIGLGLAVLVCLSALAWAVIRDLRLRSRNRAGQKLTHDDHTFSLSSLGITMADGGEPIDEKVLSQRWAHSESDDPPNIIRSDT